MKEQAFEKYADDEFSFEQNHLTKEEYSQHLEYIKEPFMAGWDAAIQANESEGFKDINTVPLGYIQEVGVINPPSTYITSSDDEMIRFAEWCAGNDEFKRISVKGEERKIWWHYRFERAFNTSELIEKFRSLPPSPPKD
jgi:hypothetical protein